MSQENVEMVRWAFTSDPSRFYSLLHDDVEFDGGPIALPGLETVGRGREALKQWSREFWTTWAGYSAEPTDIIDAGDEVVVEVHERGRGKGSGVPFARTHVQVWTFRDGKVIRWQLFVDKAQALETVGLTE